MAIPVVSGLARKVFGTRNDRLVKRYLGIVNRVSDLEDEVRTLDDSALRAKTAEFKRRHEAGEKTSDLQPEAFAVAREAMDRAVGIRTIFDPDAAFDPKVLSDEARALYEQTKAAMDAAEPQPPTGALLGNTAPVPAWMWMDIPLPLYDAVRAVWPESRPPFRARPFDVQIIGGMVLYEGRIAEMKTGEGKTIVAPLSCYLSVIEGKQVHLVTVNEYLVQRDRDWMFPFFHALGMTVGAIHPQHMQPTQLKQIMYHCDVVYGTTSEFGFDYLRDNMKMSVGEQVQRKRQIAIVDEVDSTLIDEARTPLIIAGPAHDSQPRYELADRLACHLLAKQTEWNRADEDVQKCLVRVSSLEGDIRNARDRADVPDLKRQLDEQKADLPKLETARDKFTQYYEVELDKKRATLTHDGIAEAQRESGLGSFYVGENIDMPHLLEQAIRGHSVYQRDRDYIVAPDDQGQQSIVIVDQNTGRKMVGRQWSDGLHQAIEAKESVPIKQETQTMATITIQNFFKLYERLSGMTGTADTEATEFYEIYSLDVVVIPTNVPVVRGDHNDVVFLSVGDKQDAIIDEVARFHDIGRPVLVGTTSVENSKEVSDLLKKRHSIKHEVLNAEQHERESEIVKHAGELGAVMIATNMAGRGTDIKLQPFTPGELVEHWKRRDLCPADVTADMPEAEIVARCLRHVAPRETGASRSDIAALSDEQVRRMLLEAWYEKHCYGKESKAKSMSDAALLEAIDESGACTLHRLRMFDGAEDLGGLHVVGTERHESRRIDNQLRGRSGRQGDKGSSRFFLSLEDPLMKMFAGPTTLKLLSRLGMKEGDAIEHPMLSKAVGRAQRKVEERNFLVRKNILEYDEVMDHQRHEFYGTRQRILEGRDIKELIFDHLEQASLDAAWRFYDPLFPAKCISEWVREHMSVTIDPTRLKTSDREDLHGGIRQLAREESMSILRVSIGEFLTEDIDLGDGALAERDAQADDWKGLADWMNGHFGTSVTVADLEGMDRSTLFDYMEDEAEKALEVIDLGPLDVYLVEDYPKRELAQWVSTRFGVEFAADRLLEAHEADAAAAVVLEAARTLYREREVCYPIDFAIDMTTANIQSDPAKAIGQFCNWAKSRYEVDWTPESLPATDPQEIRTALVEIARTWDDEKMAARAAAVVESVGTDVDAIDTWFRETMGAAMSEAERESCERDPAAAATDCIRRVMRSEVSHLEQWILLQILDSSWKEHLHQMDQLRESIGYRSFSQRDPRIEFKREGANLFEDMLIAIRDKVTDLVFKARLQPQVRQKQQPQAAADRGHPADQGEAAPQPAPEQPASQADPEQEADRSAVAAAAAAASKGRRVRTGGGAKPASAAAATGVVGRNEPCPCGSGKKYKKCCGAT
ncbi:MAG: preprotein translocase subunit SecA [Phycisphaerales bacterium]|jgi:preprotein translocase subunit SecA|nr:preprotein translocase subunit SecA [Phycisphaerales bacterium]